MDAHFGYIAIVSDQPQALADFYAEHFQMWELGRSAEGDVSITDGFVNVSILKQRAGVEGASGRPGLSHFGIAVNDIREVEANLEEHAPGNVFIPTDAGGFHRDFVANVSQIVTVDRAELTELLGLLPRHLMAQIDDGVRLALDV